MGLLDGDLAGAIYAGFKGKLLKGVIRQTITPASGALNTQGDPADLPAPVDTKCEGFTEAYSLAFIERAGIPRGDLKINIFAASIPGLRPGADDKVRFDRKGVGRWFQLRGADTDPAEALWVCQGFEIPEPDDGS